MARSVRAGAAIDRDEGASGQVRFRIEAMRITYHDLAQSPICGSMNGEEYFQLEIVHEKSMR